MSGRILLILGHGKNVGEAVAQKFRAQGYRVAISSRSIDETRSDEGILPLKCDYSDPKAVEGVFESVRKTWGEPSVVFYNAASSVSAPAENPLQIPTDALEQSLHINVTSAWVAAREALAGFKRSGPGPKTFAYTGNWLPWHTYAPLMALGVGKTGMTHLLESVDKVFREKDFRFFFVDERKADGNPMWKGVTGSAHAEFLYDVAERKAGDVPWKVTFVDGQGYKAFEEEAIV